MLKHILLTGLVAITVSGVAQAQSSAPIVDPQGRMGVGTLQPDPSSILDLSSTQRGALLPRLTDAQRNGIANPAKGLVFFNLDSNEFQFNFGTPGFPLWMPILDSSNIGDFGWALLGNGGTNPAVNYIGTTDAQDFVVRTNATERMRILSGGNVGIGISGPAAKLHVNQMGLDDAGRFEIANAASASNALLGSTNGTGVGVLGLHSATSGTAAGVRGESNSTDAMAMGVSGVINSTAPGGFSAGVRGINNGTGAFGVGVYGSQAGSGWGVYGTTPSGIGVRGTSTSGYAVYGQRGAGSGITLGQIEAIRGDNTDGPGVAGTSNTAVGIYGTSTTSHGVWGVGQTAATAGVLGRNDVVGGYGVRGESFGGGIGVHGTSQTGNASQFEITNAASTADAVQANQAGLGRGVYAVINNTSNIVAAVRGETNGGGYGLFGQATGNGNAGFFQINNAASNSSTVNVTTNGFGSGITVQLTNASNGGRGIDVMQNGEGTGVFATSAGGFGVWGISSDISAAGVIGDNTFGEAVVGRNRSGNGVGAVVGRNDSSGYGVRGFNTKNGIGVIGQAGISGGTGVGGRFENVNAANSNDALQAATNGTGWAGNFTNVNNSSATRGVRITTTAGQGGNALTVNNGTVAFSYQHPYASNTVVDDATLVVTTAGNVTIPTGAPLVDGAHVWVVNNAGAVVTVTNTTAGAFNINPGRAVELLFVSTVSGANWIPVQP